MREYTLLMKAVELQGVDREYRIHRQAYENMRVKAQKKTGKRTRKPVYSTFKKFFDYEKVLNAVFGKKIDSKFSGLEKHLKEENNVTEL